MWQYIKAEKVLETCCKTHQNKKILTKARKNMTGLIEKEK